jgi:adenine-specific DNA methylase
MARSLIETWTRQGDLIVDPFCGCGTVAVEAAANGRGVVAGDWNPYAALLTRAKLFPPAGVRAAERRLQHVWKVSRERLCEQDLRTVPKWVRQFFHPRTLRSTLAVRDACVETSSINIRR